MTTRHARAPWGLLGWLVAMALLAGGCAAQAAERVTDPVGGAEATSAATPGTVSNRPQATDPQDTDPQAGGPVPDARVGKPAASTRVRFIPHQLVLAGGSRAAVEEAPTVAGELKVPEDVRHLGWWDGGAQAGDPFGAIVVAGHVDSKTQGLGFFARLLRVRTGQKVTLSGEGHHLTYKVTKVQTVKKDALAADSAAFGQDGGHRLVLITCTGAYRPQQGGYDSNLVVIAEPVGRAR